MTLSGSIGSAAHSPPSVLDRFDRPIFLVSTPRSGSTLLYETLVNAPGLFATGDESHRLIESVPGLAPQHRGWLSNQLVANDALPDRAEMLAASFYQQLKDRDGRRAHRAHPDARKDAEERSTGSILRCDLARCPVHLLVSRRSRDSLQHDRSLAFGGFQDLSAPTWLAGRVMVAACSFPGWQRLKRMQLPEIVAHQWAIATEVLLDDLSRIEEGRIQAIDYGSSSILLKQEMVRIAAGLGLGWDRQLGDTLPLSKTTVSNLIARNGGALSKSFSLSGRSSKTQMRELGNSSLRDRSRYGRLPESIPDRESQLGVCFDGG